MLQKLLPKKVHKEAETTDDFIGNKIVGKIVDPNCQEMTGNLLKYLYHQSYYKLIGLDLSRQTNTPTNTSIPQQFNFVATINYSKLFFRFIKHKTEQNKQWNSKKN